MSSPFSQVQEVKRWKILNREYKELSDGRQFSRKGVTSGKAGEWIEITEVDGPSSSQTTEPKKLYLVLQTQCDGPMHWSLFVCRGDSPSTKGTVWQVSGDALLMHYQHEAEDALFNSDTYHTSYALNTYLSDNQDSLVREAVAGEEPPRAENQRLVKENCQGWTIRVFRRLQREGVVAKETIDWIENELKEPINR